jgi:Pectate lyase superfamily protein
MAITDRRGQSVSLIDAPAATTPNADLAIKTAVRVASTGANINLQTFGLGTLDGIVLAANDRVLLKDQTDATQNGIYKASSGVWARATDANNNSQWANGAQVYVNFGAANGGTVFALATADPITLGTSLLKFVSAGDEVGWFNVRNYGAFGDGAHDDTTAIQAAINAAIAAGDGTVYFPRASASYLTTAQLLIDVSGIAARFKGALLLIGDGPGASVISNTTLAGAALLHKGNTSQVEAYFSIENLRLTGNTGGIVSGSFGLQLNVGAFIRLRNAVIEFFDLGLDAVDVEQISVVDCEIRYNNGGVRLDAAVSVTAANSWTFENTAISNNAVYGLQATNPNAFTYLGGSIQYNGTIAGAAASQWGAKLIECGNGYGTVAFLGMVFEGNGGAGDLISSQSANPCAFSILGVSFLRTNQFSGLGYGTNNVSITGTQSNTYYRFSGCTFRGLAGYVASAGRPVLNIANTNARVEIDGSNYFQLALEAPSLVNLYVGFAGVATGAFSLAGATSGLVTIQAQAAAGTYNFNLPNAAGSSGQPLLSGGGGSSPQTYGTLGVAAGGTGVGTLASNGVLYGNGTSAVQVTAQGGANTILTANAGPPTFSASPVIGTSVTCPLFVGGSAVGSSLSLQSTSGVGTTDFIRFLVGNNGATEAMRILHSGSVVINGVSVVTAGDVFSVGGQASVAGAAYFGANAHFAFSGGTGAGVWLASNVAGVATADRFFYGSDAASNDTFRLYSALSAANLLTINANATPSISALTWVGSVSIQNANASTSTTTGALVVTGGVGIGGTINTPAGASGGYSIAGTFILGTLGSYVVIRAPASGNNAIQIGDAVIGDDNSYYSATHHNFRNANASSTFAILGPGLQIGAPTGGDKGAGTINVATGIYLNNTAYTNPDFVLEHAFTGKIEKFASNPRAKDYAGLMPLSDLRAFMASNLRLPRISNEPTDIFERGDIALEKLEEAHLYILELHERVAVLETRMH